VEREENRCFRSEREENRSRDISSLKRSIERNDDAKRSVGTNAFEVMQIITSRIELYRVFVIISGNDLALKILF